MIEFGILDFQRIPITAEIFTYPEKDREYEVVTEIDLYIDKIIFGYIQKRHTYKNNWYYIYEFREVTKFGSIRKIRSKSLNKIFNSIKKRYTLNIHHDFKSKLQAIELMEELK